MRKGQNMCPTKRLKARTVRQPNGCLEWQGAKDGCGYGLMRVGGQLIRTHIVAFKLYVGAVPEGWCVCHTCDNPSCCNHEHLWVGTRTDNNADRDHKGRHKDSWPSRRRNLCPA